jgi:hypothetical protein
VIFNPSVLAVFLKWCMVVSGRDDNQISERFVTTLFADITDPSEILNLLTVPWPLPPVMADLRTGLMLDVIHKITDRTKGQQWRVRTLIQVPLLRDVHDNPIRSYRRFRSRPSSSTRQSMLHLRIFWASMSSTGVPRSASSLRATPICF